MIVYRTAAYIEEILRPIGSWGIGIGFVERFSVRIFASPRTDMSMANSRVHRLLTFDTCGLFFDGMGISSRSAMSMYILDAGTSPQQT